MTTIEIILLIVSTVLYLEGLTLALGVCLLTVKNKWLRIPFVLFWPLTLPSAAIKLVKELSPLLTMLGLTGTN